MRELPFRVAAVTGATGFLGRHLVELLADRGVRVRALVRNGSALPRRPEVELVTGDVCDGPSVARLVAGADVVFHSAALVVPWVRRPAEQYAVNVGGTDTVVAAAEERTIPIVATSSIVVLDRFPPPPIVRLVDGNHYVVSKRAALERIRAARRNGLAISTVLPSGIVGPGDSRPTGLGRLIRQTATGGKIELVFAGGLYLVDVRDVAEAHVQAALGEPDDYALPGEYWPIERLLGRVDELAGRKPWRISMPAPLVAAGALAATAWAAPRGRTPLITPAWVHYFRQAGAAGYRDDAPRLRVRPRPVTESLADAVTWFLGNEAA